MLPPVIPCDDKYYKNMSALVPIKTNSEAKNAKDALIEVTGETRQPVEFRPCPDCGCREYPHINRLKVFANSYMATSYVKAICKRCDWETQEHKNVKECAKEWNEAEV